MSQTPGRYSRGYLPHIEAPGRTQFITWRLADAVPLAAIDVWRSELAHATETERARELARRIETFADAGHGHCHLRDPRCARIVQECLLHDHPKLYCLRAWVVMPNHVHVLLEASAPLQNVMRRLKSVSATRINRLLGCTGQLWQEDYFDRLIRDEEHLARVHSYIEWNPVKAGLCRDPGLYPWSSANLAVVARLAD